MTPEVKDDAVLCPCGQPMVSVHYRDLETDEVSADRFPHRHTMTDLVVPGTGQLVDLDDPVQCAQALSAIRALEGDFRDLKSELTARIAAECSRQGSKSIQVDGNTVAEVKGGTETIWDVEILRELQALGLPEERWHALVTETVEYKVNSREADRIAGANPDYRRVIDAARTVIPKPVYVSFRRQRS